MKPTYFRNLRASGAVIVRTAGAPIGRLILPGATTSLPIDRTVLADSAVQARLARARIAVLDRGGWCADLRQRRAAELDWAELLRQAEQREIGRLRVGMAPPRQRHKLFGKPRNRWTAERIAELRALLLSDATSREIAAAMGLARGSVAATARRFGLTRQSRQQAATGP
jgi:hypothetical protein